MLTATTSGTGPWDALLAALNVLQTVALAYLAARAHFDGQLAKRNGAGTGG